MDTADNTLGGRLALLRPDALTTDQRQFFDRLQTKTVPWANQAGFEAMTGEQQLIGPFNPMLRSPAIATALLAVESTESQHTALSERQRQVVILTVGAVWQAGYELYAHTAVARKAGLPETAIQALIGGQSPVDLPDNETLAYTITRQIVTTHRLSEDLYQQAVTTFGEKGLFDLLVLAGQYMSVGAILNAFNVPAPGAQSPLTGGADDPGATPFWVSAPLRPTRRGEFWIPSERVEVQGKTYQRGPMYVAWEAPEHVTRPYPVILVHGGTWQGTEWMNTPDGRPGWAQRLVEAGYAVFVVDRPGHGRSPYHPGIMGEMGQPFDYDEGLGVYFPADVADTHTQQPFAPDDAAALDAFIAPFGPLPANLADSQAMDADRLARLLDRTGPAILITHSASGPDGWLVADRRPSLVKAIVAVEPMSPPFAFTPGIGTLDWGITAAPVTYDPPRNTPAEAHVADPATRRIPALTNLPVALVTSELSTTAKNGPVMVDFLKTAGAAAELLHLPDYGVMGNGHGLIFEKNSDQTLAPVLRWLATHVENP